MAMIRYISAMKIAIAQMNATVGDIAGNVERIIDFAARARTGGAHVMVTPELAVCGYPPEDLLFRDDFMRACAEAVADLTRRVRGITEASVCTVATFR